MTFVSEKKYAPYGVAYAPPGTGTLLLPESGTRVQSWNCLHMELRDGAFADYLANNKGLRLCSEPLREIIEHNRSPTDELQWLETVVQIPGMEGRRYYVLHFPVDYAVVNEEKSIINKGMVVKPVFSREGIRGHEIFALPRSFGQRAFVTARLKGLIERSGMTGIGFSKAPVAE